jgi:D-alanine transaminase
MPELAYVNHRFVPLAEATVPIEDRGFQFGDGVYEVIVAYNGQPFLLEEHLHRLRRSCEAIELKYDFDGAPLVPIIRDGLDRCGFKDAMVYIQLTRGVAPRSHLIPTDIQPTLVMTFKPLPTLPDELRRRGAKVITIPDTRWANCYIKAVTLLPNVLARHKARQRGCDDAIFVTKEGEVRECTAANVFIVAKGELLTPPLTESILHGVTQRFLLTCARSLGLTAREQQLFVDDLYNADELFLSSTTAEVLAITEVDGQSIGSGQPGPITHQIHVEFVNRAKARGNR